ncbi:hypothetical protein GQ457_03G028360 [Hibiscus cannabinus]
MFIILSLAESSLLFETVKSAYNLLVDSVTADGSFNWSGVWRLALPQRICSFLWLALQGGLLTNVERCRRHLSVDVVCTHCRQISEDLIHVLRDCFCTQSLWMSIEWLVYNLELNGSNVGLGMYWRLLFAIICWKL